MMRRMHICEEGGTGIDKVIEAVEMFQLPAPDFKAILGCQGAPKTSQSGALENQPL